MFRWHIIGDGSINITGNECYFYVAHILVHDDSMARKRFQHYWLFCEENLLVICDLKGLEAHVTSL